MTVTAAPAGTTESRAAALALFTGQVPCLFSLTDPSCPATAQWVAHFAHEVRAAQCDRDDPWPLCDEHKRLVQAIGHPFWRTWHNMPPVECAGCGTPLRADRFEPIGGGHG
jgi:hypothetical protein